MKYYIATSIKRAKELNILRDVLNKFDHVKSLMIGHYREVLKIHLQAV